MASHGPRSSPPRVLGTTTQLGVYKTPRALNRADSARVTGHLDKQEPEGAMPGRQQQKPQPAAPSRPPSPCSPTPTNAARAFRASADGFDSAEPPLVFPRAP